MMLQRNHSSIAVQWGRVNCIDRNSEITGYTVRYGQTGSTTNVMESVSGTSDSDRVFTGSGLIPRTSYTFEVAAVSSESTGPFRTGSVETLKGILICAVLPMLLTVIGMPTLGLEITGSSFLVEGTTTLTCQTDLNVTLIEWLDSDMMLLLNGSNSVLHLPKITEAGEYTCRITYPNGEVQTNTTGPFSTGIVVETLAPEGVYVQRKECHSPRLNNTQFYPL